MGYRIELGEIETTLNSFPAIQEVACFFDPERDRIHCVYTGTQDSKAIAKQARASLPRNPNGKIDRPRLREEYLGHETH